MFRDGIMPEPQMRTVRFLTAESREFFEQFGREFEGRKIVFDKVDEDRVRLSSADAMEFLYTYTCGGQRVFRMKCASNMES